MFGRPRRTKTSSEKFIISKGVDAGNLKGRGTAEKSAPTHKGSPLSVGQKLFSEQRLEGRIDYSRITKGKT